MTNIKGMAITLEEEELYEGSSCESDFEDGEWHNFALMENELLQHDGEK